MRLGSGPASGARTMGIGSQLCRAGRIAAPGFASAIRGAALRRHSAAADAATIGAAAQQAAGTAAPAKLSGGEVRERFLSFFEAKGHTRLPSSSLVPEDPTVLLTIAGMLQFKPVFLGQSPRKVPRATTTQKCVRTNDIENVGVTARHHTFFEMLGNFSFGDYFKTEAIQWSWELSTRVYGLPPERVWVSVFEEDDEAYAIWRDVVGVPEARIKRMGAADNFWASGPTGPCGPCSELYYDFHPERGTGAAVSLEDDSRFIEFYNLVFMEMNRDAEGALTPLAAKNIDTGMGLERMAQILQGVPNNYETDLIFPILAKAASLAGVDYGAADDGAKTALKVIGDHVRAVSYLISDGVVPSNVGRGYVVRRLIRRVVMKGRLLGIQGLFLRQVAEVAVGLSGACDPQVASNAQRIYDELTREEEAFVATLAKGQKLLDELLDAAAAADAPTAAGEAGGRRRRGGGGGGAGVVGGADAFLLYDSYGFPLELTQELADARGIKVDVAGFEAAMGAQRQRSKASREEVDLTAGGALAAVAEQVGPTEFVGYTQLEGAGRVVAMLVDGQPAQEAAEGARVDVLLDRTPFYAESGGQAADAGLLQARPPGGPTSDAPTSDNDAAPGGALLEVADVQKAAGGRLFVHSAVVKSGVVRVGDDVSGRVDARLRRRVAAHHTATHLLQSALKAVLGPDTCQQGSLVNAERLRFDFNLGRPMAAAEVAQVEALVNGWVADATPSVTKVMPLDEARAAGATAMFGEKYDDVVRVVDVPGVSMELCGGTHVSNTSEIGAFKVVSEGGIASGVRRIEAVAGQAAVEYLRSVDGVVRQLAGSLKARPEEIAGRVAGLQDELKAAAKQLAELKSQLAVAKSQALAGQAARTPGGAALLVATLDGVDAKALQEAASSLLASLGDPAAVLLATAAPDGKANFVCALSAGAVKGGLNAGKVVGAVAKVCGGGGGGKPALAQAGGKDAAKLPEALEAGRAALAEGLP
ncbi:MAG: tRNA synthetases class II (A)-domain-containing protein [Monoraphidium minutum]|nr:MAG: tRNA synthetases class II (A)-domain-containing protein [Monoraphidium minutum]